MPKKPIVDKEKCIGCGTCVALAPKSFKMDGDSKSVALDPAGDDEATVQNSADSCPVGAISFKE